MADNTYMLTLICSDEAIIKIRTGSRTQAIRYFCGIKQMSVRQLLSMFKVSVFPGYPPDTIRTANVNH
jgi:hypothetical protein